MKINFANYDGNSLMSILNPDTVRRESLLKTDLNRIWEHQNFECYILKFHDVHNKCGVLQGFTMLYEVLYF
jgi:hypothetical protein